MDAPAPRAIRNYAIENIRAMPVTIRFHQQVGALCERRRRSKLADEPVLRERAALFAEAEAAFRYPPGSVSNVMLANKMTYESHYRALENILDALGSDLGRLVAFFREVDTLAPDADDRPRRRLTGKPYALVLIRAQETRVLETAASLLRRPPPTR